jgi:mannan endo-1,4-beta-mannosidase
MHGATSSRVRTWKRLSLTCLAISLIAACTTVDPLGPSDDADGDGKSDAAGRSDAGTRDPGPDATVGAADAQASGDASSASCTDVPPDDPYTCGEQVGWGKCDEPFMAGRCDRSCGRCPGIGNVVEACSDTPPSATFTCAQQAGWGKCDEPWMAGFCNKTCDRCPVSAQLIDPQATAGARALMGYLVSVHRTAVLSGQQSRADADYMESLTGHLPALVGFDLMDYSPSRVAHGSSSTEVDAAIAWANVKGGIVTLSWHWNAPADLVDSAEWPWWKGFYSSGTTFDFPRAMHDRTSTERRLLLRDIDAIAAQLLRLQDAGVTVLWRPIHEASGGWFWWGAHGAEPYLMLWRLLYDRLVNHHHLHNLIWVWNGQRDGWYPGDAYVDIVGQDIYDTKRDYQPQEAAYLKATRYPSVPKLAALTETGVLPDPQRMVGSQARWSWFMLWSGDFARTQLWNEDWLKQRVYDSDFVITLDELPALKR